MSTRQKPICGNFPIPFHVTFYDRIYLQGYSYFKLQVKSISEPPLAIMYASREETMLIPELRWALSNVDTKKIMEILDTNPAIPRLLITTRGRCDKDMHQVLFGVLLYYGRARDLERLYGIVFAEDNNSGEPIFDADEDRENLIISQEETFGSRLILQHEGIVVKRSNTTTLLTCWSSDEVSKRRDKNYQRWPTLGIPIERIVGSGTFGFVFKGSNRLFKYGIMPIEYCRELLSQLVLTMTSDSLPIEVTVPTFATTDMIRYHLLELHQLKPITRDNVLTYSEEFAERREGLTLIDRLALILRRLIMGVKALRDRFVMHLDLSTTNIMWDSDANTIRIIDFGGTIGDDSFLDLGHTVSRVCTRSTRPPEYHAPETMWQRNESSETLSVYYALMSHVLAPDIINVQPYVKEPICSEYVEKATRDIPVSSELYHLHRVHTVARSRPIDRPSIDWVLSTGSEQEDQRAIEMGCIGSVHRFAHIRHCFLQYVNRWPRGRQGFDDEWRTRRNLFIAQLISRIDCPGTYGTTCGGLVSRLIPPPYITARCITLYDALRDLVLESRADSRLEFFMRDNDSYSVLMTAILYVALAPSKASLVDIEHHAGHPVHVILQTLLENQNLVSLFLSPITVFALLVLETPHATQNDQAAHAARLMQPRTQNSHRIIRCLYNLRRDNRSQPMCGSTMNVIGAFTRSYMTRLLREPFVVENESVWWKKLLRTKPTADGTSLLDLGPEIPPLSSQCASHIDNIIRMWFS